VSVCMIAILSQTHSHSTSINVVCIFFNIKALKIKLKRIFYKHNIRDMCARYMCCHAQTQFPTDFYALKGFQFIPCSFVPFFSITHSHTYLCCVRNRKVNKLKEIPDPRLLLNFFFLLLFIFRKNIKL
jgi:hypothetical protein